MFYHLYGIEVYGSTHTAVQSGIFGYFSRIIMDFVQYPVLIIVIVILIHILSRFAKVDYFDFFKVNVHTFTSRNKSEE